MKKVSLLITILLLFILPSVSAVDLTSYGIQIQSSTAEDGITTSEAVDDQGRTFELQTTAELSAREAEGLLTILDNIYSWDYMTIATLRIAFTADRIEFTVVPESFSYKGTDFTQYLPSGMQFYFTDYIEYDFRMLISDYVVKVRGQFFSEEQLCEKMTRAVENPVAYIQTTDPQYLFQQITELWENIDEVKNHSASNEAIAEERYREFLDLQQNHRTLRRDHLSLQDDYKQLRNDHESLKEAHSALDQSHQNLQNAHTALVKELDDRTERFITALEKQVARAEQAYAELDTKRNELRNDHETLTENHNQLKQNHEALLADVTTLKQAILMVANQGLFSSIGKSNVEGINRYIALRKENPAMSGENALDQVKAEGLKISGKEALLADIIYFSEFEEKTK